MLLVWHVQQRPINVGCSALCFASWVHIKTGNHCKAALPKLLISRAHWPHKARGLGFSTAMHHGNSSLPGFSLTVRRKHDVGMSRSWCHLLLCAFSTPCCALQHDRLQLLYSNCCGPSTTYADLLQRIPGVTGWQPLAAQQLLCSIVPLTGHPLSLRHTFIASYCSCMAAIPQNAISSTACAFCPAGAQRVPRRHAAHAQRPPRGWPRHSCGHRRSQP